MPELRLIGEASNVVLIKNDTDALFDHVNPEGTTKSQGLSSYDSVGLLDAEW
jgi:hypothetical protein